MRDHKDMCYKEEDCGESYDDEDAKRAINKANEYFSRKAINCKTIYHVRPSLSNNVLY